MFDSSIGSIAVEARPELTRTVKAWSFRSSMLCLQESSFVYLATCVIDLALACPMTAGLQHTIWLPSTGCTPALLVACLLCSSWHYLLWQSPLLVVTHSSNRRQRGSQAGIGMHAACKCTCAWTQLKLESESVGHLNAWL